MAQRILGLDIGSRSVKAVLLESSGKRFEVVALEEVLLPPPLEPERLDTTDEEGPSLPGDEPGEQGEDEEQPSSESAEAAAASLMLERLAVALEQLRTKLGPGPVELCVTALPAQHITVRQLTLPFVREREIQLVLGQEVEEYLPFRDIEDVIFDHQVLRQEDGKSELQVAICRRDFLVPLLELLQRQGFDPRIVTAGGLPLGYLAALLQSDTVPAPPLALIDLGHECTTISIVVAGRVVMCRTLLRGGQQLVAGLARAYSIDEEQATSVLQSEVEILPAQAQVDYHPERHRLSRLVQDELRPVVRGIRQALLAFSGVHDQEVRDIWLCGGLAALPGIAAHLGAALRLPVHTLDLTGREWAARLGPGDGLATRGAEALALALAGLPQSLPAPIDFRKGTLAYQGGYQFVRGKVLAIAAVVALLVVALGFFAFAKARDLGNQEEALIADLKARTQVLLGEPMDNAEAAIARMRRTDQGGKKEGIPSQSAYDLLHFISRQMPAGVEVDLESVEIDLDRHRAELRGKTTTATAVEDIVESLDRVPCFQGGIEKEKNEKVGSEGKQLFVLTVKLNC